MDSKLCESQSADKMLGWMETYLVYIPPNGARQSPGIHTGEQGLHGIAKIIGVRLGIRWEGCVQGRDSRQSTPAKAAHLKMPSWARNERPIHTDLHSHEAKGTWEEFWKPKACLFSSIETRARPKSEPEMVYMYGGRSIQAYRTRAIR